MSLDETKLNANAKIGVVGVGDRWPLTGARPANNKYWEYCFSFVFLYLPWLKSKFKCKFNTIVLTTCSSSHRQKQVVFPDVYEGKTNAEMWSL